MPAPKQNPALIAAAIALRVAKAAKAAKAAKSIAKKPVVKVQPELKIPPRLKFGKIMNAKSNVKVRTQSVGSKFIRNTFNEANSTMAKNAKSGKAAREKAEDIKSRVGTAAKKPTIKITGK